MLHPARRSLRQGSMKLIIGNKAYSSWSLRGWLACKQSGLLFEEAVVPLYDAEWDKRREGDEFAPSSGKVGTAYFEARAARYPLRLSRCLTS